MKIAKRTCKRIKIMPKHTKVVNIRRCPSSCYLCITCMWLNNLHIVPKDYFLGVKYNRGLASLNLYSCNNAPLPQEPNFQEAGECNIYTPQSVPQAPLVHVARQNKVID